ncbi:hypothetical protein [Candidatus Palauibacter sp.]|uniref:hypothetical protein n=1 Tax=Candidatus Palauibacter sp. TaxID=3101350 RepID=UPI003CC653AD
MGGTVTDQLPWAFEVSANEAAPIVKVTITSLTPLLSVVVVPVMSNPADFSEALTMSSTAIGEMSTVSTCANAVVGQASQTKQATAAKMRTRPRRRRVGGWLSVTSPDDGLADWLPLASGFHRLGWLMGGGYGKTPAPTPGSDLGIWEVPFDGSVHGMVELD